MQGTIRFDHPRYHSSPVSHTSEGNISNQPSTAVPAQINSRRSGLAPAAETEANAQADPIQGNRPYQVTAGELEIFILKMCTCLSINP